MPLKNRSDSEPEMRSSIRKGRATVPPLAGALKLFRTEPEPDTTEMALNPAHCGGPTTTAPAES